MSAQQKARFKSKESLLNHSVDLIQSSFPYKKSLRKFPLLISFHRALDGALLGVLLLVAIVSAIALHAQYLWSNSYARLEHTRNLSKKILESTAILERHLIKTSSLPKYMVPTKSEHLVYIDAPDKLKYILKESVEEDSFWRKVMSYPNSYGY